MALHFDGKTVQVLPRKGVWEAVLGDVGYRFYQVNGDQFLIFTEREMMSSREFLEELDKCDLRGELQRQVGKELLKKIRMQAVAEQV